MKINADYLTFESVKAKNLSIEDVNKIYEIEQDMWAEWIWEYLKCENCWEVYSKNDVFWDIVLEQYLETVSELEKKVWNDKFDCLCCWNQTKHIWGKDYIEQIKERYNDKESFLATVRSKTWEIIWFTDAYISDLDTIYKREFEHYYSEIGLDKIRDMIWVILNKSIPDRILMHSTTWIESKYSNLNIFFSLILEFYKYLESLWYKDILWICEASIWSTSHSLYHVAGARRIWSDKGKLKNTHKKSTSDIFVHENVISSVILNFDMPVKMFMKKNSKKIKEVLNR